MIDTPVRFPEPILLASASARRISALRALGFSVIAAPANVDESVFDHLPIAERVAELASLKAREAEKSAPYPPFWVVGADTLVSLDGEAFGKPADGNDARRMLMALSGRTHIVSSGVCAINRRDASLQTVVSETVVRFAEMTSREIDWYLSTGEWQDVAGAYRIQESAAFFAERVEGSFSGVVGLPLHAFYAILSRIGYPFPFG